MFFDDSKGGWADRRQDALQQPIISLINGTFFQAGAAYRSQPIAFPASFSLDFRASTTNTDDSACEPGVDKPVGWIMGFNLPAAALPKSKVALPEVGELLLFQYPGSKEVNRGYLTRSGMIYDKAVGRPEQNHRAAPVLKIQGAINADLSTTMTVHYLDEQHPDPEFFSFLPANGASGAPPGSMVLLASSSCGTRLQNVSILDNPAALTPYVAHVQRSTGSAGLGVFSAAEKTIPIRFALTRDGVSTCSLPPAVISVTKLSGDNPFVAPSDHRSSFRINECKYVYDLPTKSLAPGTYLVQIIVHGLPVGNAAFKIDP